MVSTVESIYEQLFPLTTVMKQRVVDNFSGDTLNERWATTLGGSGTVTMNDAVDGGVTCQDTATSSGMHFGQKRQYAHNASVVIWVAKINNNVSEHEFGFGSSTLYTDSQDYALTGIEGSAGTANFHLDTKTSATNTITPTTISSDTNYHIWEIICDSSDVKLNIENVLQATNTTNLPAAKLEPAVFFRSRSATTALVTANYVEAYNT